MYLKITNDIDDDEVAVSNDRNFIFNTGSDSSEGEGISW